MERITHTKIAIVGRPNVGKSCLFNRIIGSRKAIVESKCGTTRDRLYADVKWKGRPFTLVDTGGFEPGKKDDMAELVLSQLQAAIEESDIILLVTEGKSGIVPLDTEFAARLRKSAKKIYLVVNKIDDRSKADAAMEFFELGLGQPYAVSAMNGHGIEKLLDDVARAAGKKEISEKAQAVHVAIIGRPNVGKSSFVNSILSQERLIVHHAAGTTRDSIDTDFTYNGREYVLIDTAGIRHNTKIREAADFYASVRSKESIRRCDAAIAMIDGFDGLREDDKRIVETVIEEGKAMVIAVNKWDLTSNVMMSKYHDMLIKALSVIRDYPVIFVSCKTKRNIFACLDATWLVYERSKAQVGRDKLKEFLKAINASEEMKGKRITFIFLKQEGSLPPSFSLGIKGRSPVPENVKAYIEKLFRKAFDFEGVPVRIRYILKKSASRR